jgi:hypothetical protein
VVATGLTFRGRYFLEMNHSTTEILLLEMPTFLETRDSKCNATLYTPCSITNVVYGGVSGILLFVHFKLMQDARNEKIDLQPTPPGYALRPVTRAASCADGVYFCLEYITKKLADCSAMEGWAIVKVPKNRPLS